MAAHNSLPGLQQPATGSYPESIYFFKIYFNVIFRSGRRHEIQQRFK
jgi:hypothetical protein